MSRLLWICLAGAAGTAARYLLSGWVLRLAGPGFPWGTVTVNVLGSFLISLILQAGLGSPGLPSTLRLALTTGFLGGFTTYSTFNYETLQLFDQGAWYLATWNLLGTAASCLLAGWLGLLAGRWLAS
ncbi:MAG TPA: CrcB family protein [Thermoanaerobaculia bacterium]|nr:CrcB family protein [Thermoanaerobaculia bacterium]